ncbi:transcriptional regulator, Sir2 family [Cooperia oncophora]
MSSTLSRFVPAFKPPSSDQIKRFVDQVASIDRLLVLTGAGVSTASGIPDYRSEKIGLFERSNHRPITIQEFLGSESARKRYWSRNFLAWPNFSRAKCNEAHRAIASWERSDKFVWLITQNVDGLHAKEDHQTRLEELNAEWMRTHVAGEIAPDGDVELEEGAHETFVLPECQKCGGVLKTDVVFFGDNVASEDVDTCYEKVEQCTGVLVLGSSLTVMSGFRFPYHASLMGKPVLIVNIGPTRADSFAEMRISAPVTDIVTKL